MRNVKFLQQKSVPTERIQIDIPMERRLNRIFKTEYHGSVAASPVFRFEFLYRKETKN